MTFIGHTRLLILIIKKNHLLQLIEFQVSAAVALVRPEQMSSGPSAYYRVDVLHSATLAILSTWQKCLLNECMESIVRLSPPL